MAQRFYVPATLSVLESTISFDGDEAKFSPGGDPSKKYLTIKNATNAANAALRKGIAERGGIAVLVELAGENLPGVLKEDQRYGIEAVFQANCNPAEYDFQIGPTANLVFNQQIDLAQYKQ